MRFVKRRSFACISFLIPVVLLAFSFSWAGTGTVPAALKLTILYMNDPHAHYLPYEEKDAAGLIGGFAKAQTVMADIQTRNRVEGRHTIVFLAGDLLMGTPFSTAFKGRLGVKLMNEMKFTAMVVGNHEFDYGKENLLLNLRPVMQFPLLSSNTKTEAGEYLFDRTLVKEFPDSTTRAVILGLTTTDTPITTHPDNVKGLVFEDPNQTAQTLLQGSRDNDLIIALTHLGLEADKKLADAVPRIDVIIGGHSHTALPEPLKVKGTLICQAGAYSKYVGKLDLDTDNGKVVKYHGELIPLGPEIKEDPKIASIISDFKVQMDASLNEVIGSTEVFLEGARSAVRSGRETNLGRLITYNMAVNSGTDVAVINGGAIRGSLKEGDVTLGDVYTVLPFTGSIVRLELQGADLEVVLQRSADLEEGSGGKLQIFGITFKVEGGKVRIEKIRGRDFDPNITYSIAINDFLAAGGDGYAILKEKGKNIYQASTLLSDILINYIKTNRVITEPMLANLK